MLYNLRDECGVSTSDLSHDPFQQVDEASIHPVLPEYTDSSAEWGDIRFDHTESSMDGPKDEEDNEQVMSVPEPFKVRSTRFLARGKEHGHEREKHDISRPSRTRDEVCQQPPLESQVVLSSQLGEIVPVGDGMDPGEEDDRIRNNWQILVGMSTCSSGRRTLVESDILVCRIN